MPVDLEIVVDDAEGLAAAAAAGVDSIELCSALALGALTPSAGLMRRAAECGVPVVAMIRPRPGDFLYSAGEIAVMLDDIRAVRAAGLAGIAIGATTADGRLDRDAMGRMIHAAGPLAVTIHRARHVRLEATGIVGYADGERFAPLPLECSVVPGALSVLT